ncbi:hypothetical protein MXB_236 [Myxobolus squamalis]|nr:hypothetical protein MXB_236 [Myxobolus squamalis]
MLCSSLPYRFIIYFINFSQNLKNSFNYEILQKHINEFESTITYCINFNYRSDATKSCNFIINLFVYPELYEIFLRINGMKLTFEKVYLNMGEKRSKKKTCLII